MDSEWQATVESETVSARTAVAAERRCIEGNLIYIDITCRGTSRMLNCTVGE